MTFDITVYKYVLKVIIWITNFDFNYKIHKTFIHITFYESNLRVII